MSKDIEKSAGTTPYLLEETFRSNNDGKNPKKLTLGNSLTTIRQTLIFS